MLRPRVKGSSSGSGVVSSTASPGAPSSGAGISLFNSNSNSRTSSRKQQQQNPSRRLRRYSILCTILFVGIVIIWMIAVAISVQKTANNNNNKGSHTNIGITTNTNNDIKVGGGDNANNNNNFNNKNSPKSSSSSTSQKLSYLQSVRNEFHIRYGNYSDRLLQRGIQSFGTIDSTAYRILSAVSEERPFVFGFTGYSITVGRGNYFNQSFPFVVHNILQKPFEDIFGIELIVRNSAIGGIPSFPYGFCLEHFVGIDVDVLSWDYSMNEGSKDSSVLESFIRQALQQLPKRPMLIMLDRNEPRSNLIQKYTTDKLLEDAIMVGKKEIVESKVFETKNLPPGFQDWDVFGAPKSCPGRGSWHPKKQEHAMIGWMIAMHFVSALERAIQLQEQELQQQGGDNNNNNNKDSDSKNDNAVSQTIMQRRQLEISHTPIIFPKPYSTKLPSNNPEVTELLYGHAIVEENNDNDNNKHYVVKDVSCRTSFLPATDQMKVLPSIVIFGLAEVDLDIMIDRTDAHYKEGWVLDVSKVERDTKRKVERCGGLGYVDMKIAMYGIPESGTIRLWLPFDQQQHQPERYSHQHDHDEEISDAKHWFDDIIICEANEKRDEKACHLDKDLDIVIGGIPVSKIGIVKGAGEYLKRTTCVNVGIPQMAQITPLGKLTDKSNHLLSAEYKENKFGGMNDETVGLIVDITAKAGVTRANGACCISHVVWEQH